MNASTRVSFQGSHVLVVHPDGYEITPDALGVSWMRMGEACRQHGCYKVLVDSPATVRKEMRQAEAYQSAIQAMEALHGATVALCFPDYVPDELSGFFKLAAANRGVQVEFFQSRETALRWLGVGPEDDQGAA
ncbi:hypothetical protein H0Z60_02470 [Ectothiorhodospiraceae bacterium WFHF3C12]|nr:hypothetical protein [Ectothiorhodospiraceae bacterium WFHF3C12]